jgi:hypothetical protein
MFDDAGEHELTIADSSGESKTCQYAVQGAKNRQPYYNLVRFAIAGLSGRKMEEKDEPWKAKVGSRRCGEAGAQDKLNEKSNEIKRSGIGDGTENHAA